MLLRNTLNKPETLFNSVFEKKNTTHYTIISGYIGVSMAKELIKISDHYDQIDVIVGMYGGVLDSQRYNVLTSIQQQYPNVKFYVTKKQIHSKLYIWHNNENIESYLIGSANFSRNALLHSPQREVLEFGRSFNDIAHYLSVIKEKGIEIELDPQTISKTLIVEPKEISSFSILSTKRSKVNLIGKTVNASEPHGAAGLNWGYSWAGPALNDAYIRIPIEKVRKGYIPSKEGGKKVVFDAIWDDGEVMSLSFEGTQRNISGDYPKQISSYPNKHILGDYLRQRISNKIGIDLVTTDEENDFRMTFYNDHPISKYRSLNEYEKRTFFEEYALKKGKIDLYKSIKAKFITMNHLNKYGRHDIDLTKTEDDDTFFIDFSV